MRERLAESRDVDHLLQELVLEAVRRFDGVVMGPASDWTRHSHSWLAWMGQAEPDSGWSDASHCITAGLLLTLGWTGSVLQLEHEASHWRC